MPTKQEIATAQHAADQKREDAQARLLQLAEFSFKTIKYWSGFADDFCSKTPKCSANM